ncbi:hypothetical protein CENSYa_1866 [Cenarchaeum symbiosum A]|uniref:Uncharacterized protein n=1 Tax=Cenarchaeum symbiosum (strain A) TaxID=414004 RepID=A0RYQ8_CENSY|nr:hypothetical protein CENSYa_1866 [Cenarchaeum symbiosum A]
MLKIIIILCVVAVGVTLFMPQTSELFPEIWEIADSVRNDLTAIGGDVGEQLKDGINGTLAAAGEQIDVAWESSEGLFAAADSG